MALISETSDDVSNGSDPNKNPEDIPLILIERTVALIRICHYPRLSLLSRTFLNVISSEHLFVTRSLLGLTEPVLYALITLPPFTAPSWFILHRSNMSLRLSRISSLPPMSPGCTAVTIGHKIYVMGGRNGLNQPVNTVIVIDCRFHKWENLQSMKRERCFAASGVIDGKIYVVGGRKKRYEDWVEVFDVENGVWETVPGLCCYLASSSGVFPIHVVLDNKIYILDGQHCLAYDPRLRRWDNWGPESPQRHYWYTCSCVVDDLLYTIVPQWYLAGSLIVVYDPRDMVWRPVKGVDHLPSFFYVESKMSSFGGKLVLLGWHESQNSCGHDSEKIVVCVEVALGRSEDGDIWGKVESTSPVHSSFRWPSIDISRTVTV
ncbi:PREDICTED: putative F-box/kelch-repeat protein At2g29800 isoform X2 [Camelina sativa]|uniref:F-box/kelch-repeat protein At2g29800 isoform X2 n=1 Tax=Camelina sativa TaxID=90675 RepID=A0ABM1RQ07_CAMSA|nr:PREDICTED: putative F-box/kelch-repeat protein At2g29800 isoform X2 [Camelina sativa]